MELSKSSLRALFHYSIPVFCYLFPGLFAIDVAYDVGLFSKPPTDLYAFTLLVFWAGVASAPFGYLVGIALPLQRYAAQHGLEMRDLDDYEDAFVEFPLTVVSVFIFYVSFRLLVLAVPLIQSYVPLIPPTNVRVVLAFVCTVPIVLAVAYPYRALVFWMTKRALG